MGGRGEGRWQHRASEARVGLSAGGRSLRGSRDQRALSSWEACAFTLHEVETMHSLEQKGTCN